MQERSILVGASSAWTARRAEMSVRVVVMHDDRLCSAWTARRAEMNVRVVVMHDDRLLRNTRAAPP